MKSKYLVTSNNNEALSQIMYLTCRLLAVFAHEVYETTVFTICHSMIQTASLTSVLFVVEWPLLLPDDLGHYVIPKQGQLTHNGLRNTRAAFGTELDNYFIAKYIHKNSRKYIKCTDINKVFTKAFLRILVSLHIQFMFMVL